jgi:hypothetical protein
MLFFSPLARAGMSGYIFFNGRIDTIDTRTLQLVDAIGQRWSVPRSLFNGLDLRPGNLIYVRVKKGDLKRVHAQKPISS